MDMEFYLCNIGTDLLPIFKDTNTLDDGYHPEVSPCRIALLHCLYNIHSSNLPSGVIP